MKIVLAVGYGFLVIGILIRVFAPGLGVAFAAAGGLAAAVATVSLAGRRNQR